MIRSLFLAVLGVAVVGCAPSAPRAGALKDMRIDAKPVEIDPGALNGLRLRGTRVLTAAHEAFGGFSGLLISQGRIRTVTDAGWWLEAPVVDLPDGLEPGPASFAPLTGQDGAPFDKAGGDAEGLAEQDGQVWISFERDHRVMALEDGLRMGEIVQPRGFETLGSNAGLEALVALPGGAMMAVAEAAGAAGHPVFVWDQAGMTQTTLPMAEPFSVTGADVGPEGRLYVLLRHYSPLTGVSIRVDRFALGDDGLPIGGSRQVLATFDSGSGIDNMEGISLWKDGEGHTRLTLISDDNFNFVQRTLLMDFELVE